MRVCARGHGARVACATDAGLSSTLRLAFSAAPRVRLVSVQPYLMSAFNGWRSRVPDEGAWFVVAEASRCCVALLERRTWVHVATYRPGARAWDDPRELIEREKVRLGAAGGPRTVLSTSGEPYAMALSAA